MGPRRFLGEMKVPVLTVVAVELATVLAGKQHYPLFLRDDPHAVVLGPATAAEDEREEGLVRLARFGRFLGDLKVTVRLGFERCPDGVATGEELMQPEREDGEAARLGPVPVRPLSSQLRSTRAQPSESAPVSSDNAAAALGRPSRGSPSNLRGTCRRSRPVPASSRTPNVDSIQDARGWLRNASYSSGGASSEATAARMSSRTGGGGSDRSISGVARSRVSPTICSGVNGTPNSACDTFATSSFCRRCFRRSPWWRRCRHRGCRCRRRGGSGE